MVPDNQDLESLGLPTTFLCAPDGHQKRISHTDSCVTTVYKD